MNNRNKNILLGVLIVGVVSMTVAFAALSTRLNIGGSVQVAATTWNIHFQNWEPNTQSTVSGHQNTAEYPSVSQLLQTISVANSTKVEGINVTLKQPGDYARYTFQFINDGSIPAELSNFTHTMTCSVGNNCSDVIDYDVKCYENSGLTGTEVSALNHSVLAPSQIAYCYLQVSYKDKTNTGNGVYSQSAISASLSADWQWVQGTTNNNSGNSGGQDSNEPAEETWNKYYSYSSPAGGSTLDSSSAYVRENTNSGIKEVCVTLADTPLCLQVNNWNTEGYISGRNIAFTSKGAECSVNADYLDCTFTGGYCEAYSYGDVECKQGNHKCYIQSDGIVGCN